MFTLDISLQRSRAITSLIYRAVFICVISFFVLGGTMHTASAFPGLFSNAQKSKEQLFDRLSKGALAGNPASQLALSRFLFASAKKGSPAYAHALGWLKLAVDQKYTPALKAAKARGLPIKHPQDQAVSKHDIPASIVPPANYDPPPLAQTFFIRLSTNTVSPANAYDLLKAYRFVTKLDQPGKLTAKAINKNTLLIGPFATKKAALQAIEIAADAHPFITSLETR